MRNIIMYKKGESSWTRWIKKRIKNNLNFLALLQGATGIGKCQPKGSKVLMANGEWKCIENIRKGDIILSPQLNGTNIFSKVIKTNKWFSNENYDVYKLNRNKEKLYSCSYNHLIPVYHNFAPKKNGIRKSKWRYWKIKNYSAKRLFEMNSNHRSHNNIGFSSFPIRNFKDRINCKIEPYTLGVILGDGMFSYKTHIVINKNYDKMKRKDKKYLHRHTHGRLSITTMDFEIIEEVSKHYPIMSIFNKKNTLSKSYDFSLNSKLSKLLKEYGLCNKKSGDKFIPKKALLSNIGYRKKLLAGLIDTDGYYSNGGYSITTKSKQMTEDILFLIYTLGGRGSIKKVKKGIKKLNFIGEYYCVSFYLKDLVLPLKIKRKAKNISSVYLDANRIAIDIKKSTPSMVYGIEIDSKSKLYITDNFMVTHNSWSALRIAYDIDKDFESRQVAFSFKQIMEIINADWFKQKKWRIIIFDEVQVDLSNRAWQSLTNKLFNYLLSTFRHQNIILLFTSPYSDFIDSQSMKLIHCKFECRGWDKKTKLSQVRPKLMQYNSRMKKFYEHSLYVIKGKSVRKVVFWYIRKPPEHLTKPYEESKINFTDALNKDILEDLNHLEDKKKIERRGDKKPLTELQEKILELSNKGLNQIQIAKKLNKVSSQINVNVKYIRNKGYILENKQNKEIHANNRLNPIKKAT